MEREEPWQRRTYNTMGLVALIPLSMALAFRGNRLGKSDPAQIAREIEEEGLREEVIFEIGQQDRKVSLGEGNHRAQAFELLGRLWIPARVMRRQWNEEGRVFDRMAAVPRDAYFPGDANPRSVFDADVFDEFERLTTERYRGLERNVDRSMAFDR